jgi:pyruvate formate lyase activating enzyme
MLIVLMKYGLIFDVKRYAIHDGPGIRTTVFFKRCPLHCWWCHNPEGQNPKPELLYRKSRCTGCGECTRHCLQQAITLQANHISINRKKCTTCGSCAQACPSDALSIVGRKTGVSELLEEIEKDRVFHEESEGGVTFSGGEPLMQHEFLNELLTDCRDRGIHTTVDTCGYASTETIRRVSGKADLFLYDLKTMDARKHAKFTGASNLKILRNLTELAQHNSIVISFPIIPGINDDDKNVTETAKLASSLPNIVQVNLLPYHRAGIDKYKSLGKPYRLNRIQPPTVQKIKAIKKKMESHGLKVGIGGG